MKTGVLILLGLSMAILVFISLGLLFYKLLPPAEPLLPLHKPQPIVMRRQPEKTTRVYRSNFLNAH